MTATAIRPSVWAKALPALPSARAKCPEACEYIGQWLAVLAVEPDRGGEFDRALEDYAAELRRAGILTPHQGSGFLMAVWSYSSVGSPLTPTLVAQVDRRAAFRGVVHCKWRGTVPRSEFDLWRTDEAVRRAASGYKHERGAA